MSTPPEAISRNGPDRMAPGNPVYDNALAALKARREIIDRAIGAMEELA